MIQVGDRVVCIKDCCGDQFFPRVVKGKRYIFNGIETFCCGRIGLDIGLEWKENSGISKCSRCGTTHISSAAPCYAIERFRKIEPEYKVVEIHSEISEQARELISLTETVAQ